MPESNSASGLSKHTSCHIYIWNLPEDFKKKETKNLFNSVVGGIVYTEVFYNKRGKSRNCAIIEFESADTAEEAIQKMHLIEVKGRKINVQSKKDVMKSGEFKFYFDQETKKKKDKNKKKYIPINEKIGEPLYMGGSDFQGTSSQWQHGQTYGLPVSFLESLGIDGPLGPRVFVAQLDHKVTDDDLREAFKIAGTVVDAEVMKDDEGRSRTIGIVEYEHPLQAVQAITMLNNQQYYNRKLVVRLDKFNNRRPPSSFKLPKGLRGVGFGLGVNGEAVKEVSELTNLQRALSARERTSSHCGNNMANNFGFTGVENPGYNMGLRLGALASAMNALSVGGYGSNANGSILGAKNQPPSIDFSLDSVTVNNLPLDCTSWDLRKLLNKYGTVKYVEILKNGIGFARLSSAAEARRVESMLDNYSFNGRPIRVFIV